MTARLLEPFRAVRRALGRSRRLAQSKLADCRDRRALRRAIKQAALSGHALKVVLGASTTRYPGWIPTDVNVLDITKPEHWFSYFKSDSIDRLLAEHVLEHLTESQNAAALALCYRFLKPGGVFRIAVPDGYRRDAAYVAEVTPPKDGHQVLFTIDTLTALLNAVGFRVRRLEYYDAAERFHAIDWNGADGFIKRSKPNDRQTAFMRNGLFYTSLIVDAEKGES